MNDYERPERRGMYQSKSILGTSEGNFARLLPDGSVMRRAYSQRERVQAIALVVGGMSMATVGRQLNVPRRTVQALGTQAGGCSRRNVRDATLVLPGMQDSLHMRRMHMVTIRDEQAGRTAYGEVPRMYEHATRITGADQGFQGSCRCGWTGPERSERAEVLTDIRDHNQVPSVPTSPPMALPAAVNADRASTLASSASQAKPGPADKPAR